MIYDITQALFEGVASSELCRPGSTRLQEIARGDVCNLTAFTMCAHNATHVDAPFHFLNDGKTIDEVALEKFIGPAYVSRIDGEVTSTDAARLLAAAEKAYPGAEKRILLRGKATVTLEAAQVFADAGVYLVGNDSQTVGPENAPMAVHKLLLKAEVVLLEGTRLDAVPDGVYYLNCAPLKLTDADGAPCRALLISDILR